MRKIAALAVWALVGPFVGLGLGLGVGWFAWGSQAAPESSRHAAAASSEAERPRADARKDLPDAGAPAAEGGDVVRAPARDPEPEIPPELRWVEPRRKLGAALVYDFSPRRMKPGSLFTLVHKGIDLEEEFGLEGRDEKVRSGPEGLEISDGGRLYSEGAGRELSRLIKKSGSLTVEALVRPADTKHGGPARIVSISYDGGKRNFTLAQEGDRWVTRLRTSKTGDNGTNPEVRADGLRPKLTHVIVTYDGEVERIYLNGREAVSSKEVAGSIEEWAEDFPLVVGNEYKDSRDWAGSIRFVAFYSRALSAGEAGVLSKSLPPGVKLPPPAEQGEGDFF